MKQERQADEGQALGGEGAGGGADRQSEDQQRAREDAGQAERQGDFGEGAQATGAEAAEKANAFLKSLG